MFKLILNTNEQVIFVEDINNINVILAEYGLVDNFGNKVSGITISNSILLNHVDFIDTYATKITYQNIIIWILPISIKTTNTTISNIYKNIHKYKKLNNISIDNQLFMGDVNLSNDILKIGNVSLSVKNALSADDTIIHNMITKLSHDNGRMLDPITKKYITLIKLISGKSKLLTGYVDLVDWLTVLKQPILQNKSIINIKVDNTITFTYVLIDNKLSMIISGIELNSDDVVRPYVLYTLKPIQLINQKFPFITLNKYNKVIFLTPVILNNSQLLKDLRGGINLLK